VFLLIDQVEDFANPDVPKKKRHMEVERFRDLAVETQPFGEMASYVLTMHPDAQRAIEEDWLLARLPRIEVGTRQTARVTVVLPALDTTEQAVKLLLPYLEHFRAGAAPDELFPFTRDAVESLRQIKRGRPGLILVGANQLAKGFALDIPEMSDVRTPVDAFVA
jgi:hypothetical protein